MLTLPNADDGDRGQVGIGTLIIFIAMVLVAAVAAGVLINTAGLLESTASDTSADSQAQVSNQLTVVHAAGNVNSGTENVTDLNFTVMKSAGSDDIDLANATVEYQSDDAAQTLSWNTTMSATDFVVYEVGNSAPIASATNDALTLSAQDERAVIRVNLTDVGDELQEGGEATVRFVDQSGAATIYGVNVPDTISDENYVAV
ncbi:flagellin [Halorubellus sp. JP-L1]|uniref:archaellin/type IV pilin N-terminal domain-containing protein n=1 Tax=Halorubellus sp. JP-L1 TaxID=2715753 RepID=UPI00140CAC01|nr:archaellin/type IV pilin N-terminal domain-containing protein [Halorubellus sp. JP-L1]NHN41643.1 flagellin [Halorubellus sp. JP-L1]